MGVYHKTLMADEIYFYGKIIPRMPRVPIGPPIPEDLKNRLDQCCERICVRNNVYHSYSYKLKRNSNSYMVSYRDNNDTKYGTVLFYASFVGSDTVWMIMRELTPTHRTLFTADMKDCLRSRKLNNYIDTNQLGHGYQHVEDTNVLVVHPAKFLIGRIVFIPDETGGYVSNTLNCYQHD